MRSVRSVFSVSLHPMPLNGWSLFTPDSEFLSHHRRGWAYPELKPAFQTYVPHCGEGGYAGLRSLPIAIRRSKKSCSGGKYVAVLVFAISPSSRASLRFSLASTSDVECSGVEWIIEKSKFTSWLLLWLVEAAWSSDQSCVVTPAVAGRSGPGFNRVCD